MSMNPDVKNRWVEALRSGKYKQGQGVLRSATDRYCCLGVLSEVEGRLLRRRSDTDEIEIWTDNGKSGCFLEESYWAAIGGSNPWQIRLSDMNDSGESFYQIADYIEQNL